MIVNPGACNPSGTAHSIIEACREIREYEPKGSTADDPAIRLMVYQLASARSGLGDGGVPKGLDRPALFGLVDRGDCQGQLFTEAFGEERRQFIVDALDP